MCIRTYAMTIYNFNIKFYISIQHLQRPDVRTYGWETTGSFSFKDDRRCARTPEGLPLAGTERFIALNALGELFWVKGGRWLAGQELRAAGHLLSIC